jgi:hypothetical protein
MCAALAGRGVAASRLLPLSATAGPRGADLVVTSPSASDQAVDQASYAPVPLASFGSGAGLIEVRAAYPGGAAAYNAALAADLAARKSAGTQLLGSRRIMVGAQGAGQLRAGEVDTRVLVTLAVLASLRPLQVVSFGEASPGGQVPLVDAPFREVTITIAGGRNRAAALAAALAMVRAQRASFRPMSAAIAGLVEGQAGLRIEFAAPNPLGLLTGGASGLGGG